MTSHGDKTLFESFEVLGQWWRPSKPQNVVAGTLRVDCPTHSTLTLGDTFKLPRRRDAFPPSFFPGHDHFSVLFGLSEKHEKITLVGVHWAKLGVTSEFRIGLVIFGAHLRHYDAVAIKQFSFSTVGLSDWCKHPRPVWKHSDKSLSVTVEKNAVTTIDLRKRKLKIDFRAVGMAIGGQKMSVYYDSLATVTPDHPMKWDRVWRTVLTLQRFIMLTSFHALPVDHLHARAMLRVAGRTKTERKTRVPTDLYFFPSPIPTPSRDFKAHRFPYPLPRLGTDIAELLDRWFVLERRIKGMANVFFGELVRSSPYQETRFFHYAQSLEAFHHKAYERASGKFRSKRQFKQIAKRIEKRLPPRLNASIRAAVVRKVYEANSFSFRDRLDQLFALLDSRITERLIANPAAFSTAVVATRNQFTHLDENRKAFEQEVWPEASDAMQTLLFVQILKACGMSDDRVLAGLMPTVVRAPFSF